MTFKELVGYRVINYSGLERGSEKVCLTLLPPKGSWHDTLVFCHVQDCCESVTLVDFELQGDLRGKILSIEEVSNADGPPGSDSYTWTFYHIRTDRGLLTMRWLGESNGYYSEEVNVYLETTTREVVK